MNNAKNFYNFGKLLRSDNLDTWDHITASQDFADFRSKHKVSDEEVKIIRRGFYGDPIEGNPQVPVPSSGLFTFGQYRGKPYSVAPAGYIEFLSRQDWLQKHVELFVYVKNYMREYTKDQLTKEEVIEGLKEIRQQLKN